eukprot:GILI01039654.1.p1 GENE.GILI01039654.1~~GILI01039654.1.p1  ORF type:complete len:100 (+),score=7.81 GILI01039654.1:41-340(+)
MSAKGARRATASGLSTANKQQVASSSSTSLEDLSPISGLCFVPVSHTKNGTAGKMAVARKIKVRSSDMVTDDFSPIKGISFTKIRFARVTSLPMPRPQN